MLKLNLRACSIGVAACAALVVLGCGGGGGGGGGTPVAKFLFFSQDTNGNGLFELDRTTGAATLVGLGSTGTTSNTIGLTETPNPGILMGSTFSSLANIASDGSGAHVIGGSASAEGLAMNINTGILYGVINTVFTTDHPVTGVVTSTLAVPPADVEGLAADPVNNLVYGIPRNATSLFVYNVTADSWSTVGNTGVTWLDPGLAFDHLSGVLYGVDSTTGSLYTINPSTGAATLVGPLGTFAGGGLAFIAK